MNDLPTEIPHAPRIWALIPSAGSGSRAATVGPKQYQSLAGSPLIEHTLSAFAQVSRLAGTAVVLAPGDTGYPAHLPTRFPLLLTAHCGGASRAQSVLNGLHWLALQGAHSRDWVLVHDAARCLITPAQIDGLIDACAADAVGGLLAHRLPDTLKRQRSDSDAPRVAGTLERSDKWLAQTPQMFRLGALADALEMAGPAVTDESSAMEMAGFAPLLIEGGSQNFKLTYPEDFALAEALLERRQATPTHKDPT
jgi:2-C-methyl-D-erythritol 4-phosphate cytidylyltransferase